MPETEARQCHFCGTWVKDGYSVEADKSRHWLSDCRPDLVEHEIGPTCTWAFQTMKSEDDVVHVEEITPGRLCYAFEWMGDETNGYKRVWTDEHVHFYNDGPM